MLVSNEQVKLYLPHRDPFLFIDSVESVTPASDERAHNDFRDAIGTKVVAHYRTKPEHPIFEGHFPGNPILPGVVQVEMMAQATSFAFFPFLDNPLNTILDMALIGIEKTKFRKPVLPDNDLIIHCECKRLRGVMMVSNCKIMNKDSELMSETEILATIKIMGERD